MTVIYNGDIRRSLELTAIPGNELYAFGTIEKVQAQSVELEIRDASGEIIQRYFPTIAPSS